MTVKTKILLTWLLKSWLLLLCTLNFLWAESRIKKWLMFLMKKKKDDSRGQSQEPLGNQRVGLSPNLETINIPDWNSQPL
jgi:hypothetical protein